MPRFADPPTTKERPDTLATAAIGQALINEQVTDPSALPAKPKKRGRKPKWQKQVAAVIALRVEGHSNREIARALGLKNERVVSRLVHMAKVKGGFSDVLDRVDGLAVPQAVENLIEGLRDGDKEYTLETLKGRGVFRQHSQVKSEGGAAPSNVMLVKIEMPQMPAGSLPPAVGAGQIVGQPRALSLPEPVVEAQVIPRQDAGQLAGQILAPAAPEPEVQHAVQESGPARVDVREQTRDGEGVGEPHPGGSPPPRARRVAEEIDDITRRFAESAVKGR